MLDRRKAILAIILLGCLVYVNALKCDFVWDDETMIKNNPYIKSWSNALTVPFRDIEGQAGSRTIFYRPVQVFSYIADYSIWKLNPAGYHLTNIVIHILTVLALYWFIGSVFSSGILAFFTCALFLVHPVHTEVVTYIAGRAESFSLLFMLLCFIFYIKQLGTAAEKPLLKAAAITSLALALLSQESSIVLPVLILIYHYAFEKKIRQEKYLQLLAVLIFYMAVRLFVFRDSAVPAHAASGLLERAPGFFIAITNYLAILLLPFGLHMEYGLRLFTMAEPRAIVGLSLIAVGLVYAVAKRKEDPVASFGILWFFVSILPLSNLYPINAYMAEHWLYVPSVGLFLIAGDRLRLMYESKRFKTTAFALLTVAVVFYSFLTIRQNNYWNDPITFFSRTLQYAPESARVNYNLGLMYYRAGRLEDAAESYRRAIALKPGYAYAYANLGVIYKETGRMDKAIVLFKKAIQNEPKMANAYENLCSIYAVRGQKKQAILLYRKMLGNGADYAQVYNKVGLVYHGVKKDKEAIGLFKKAIDIDPKYEPAYSNLGIIYALTGDRDRIIPLFTKAIEINPSYAKGYNNLAVAYYENGQRDLARQFCDKAKRLGYVNNELISALKQSRR